MSETDNQRKGVSASAPCALRSPARPPMPRGKVEELELQLLFVAGFTMFVFGLDRFTALNGGWCVVVSLAGGISAACLGYAGHHLVREAVENHASDKNEEADPGDD